MALRHLLSRMNHTSIVHAHLIKPKIGLLGPINHNLLNPNCCSSSSFVLLHESSPTPNSGSQTESPLGGICIYKGAQKDDWIINLAQFAVHSQNEKQNRELEFVRVVGASHTMVSNILYHITLEATDAKKHKIYHAIVWMQLLKQFMELLVWKPVDDRLSAVGVKRGEALDKKLKAFLALLLKAYVPCINQKYDCIKCDLKLHEAVMFHMNKTKRGDSLI